MSSTSTPLSGSHGADGPSAGTEKTAPTGPDAVPAPYTVPLAPGVSAYVQPDGGWCLNNAGFVTDGGRTLLIDTAPTVRRAELLRDAVAASGAPAPSLVVNTHHHGDHTYGNCVFAPEATIVGHAGCREQTLAVGPQLHAIWPWVEYGDVRITPATLTYTDELTVHIGDTEVRLIHPGPAHTVGDTVVWLPERRIVFTGDLVFNGGTPFIPFGSLSGSLAALDVLRGLDAETVVPGHGPVTDPGVYDTVERYFHYVAELARAGHAAGRTPLEVAREADLGEFAALQESERLVGNLHRAYAELDGLPLGAPLDLPLVLRDMAEMNGGRPLACHA
ncbi:MBL fold metallo-hydrolase [Streptomyces mobaraensis NBRC 13819 = DSM 40847]|uniref:MBL fold metallo-hydrolase n=2 Tax=Streptomyces mobaraensis TaxID=35621 RepID=A0A5N5VY25_STRMB|nr:MBL fold metallo-hydrolase [Streptomyces mobaraensis]EME99530.1 polyketide cyclase [Streptomyces mobaraensis NBRC 13819 = DSM 40847]KAB7833712.1 MBL fold metallo-hydrolase [Streptomyces mobaraensis]QTT73092.1 MBL fold metallo-hydrolase [Streptomyces mobaraensis NBRC 13819 = DSM 40847]